MILEQNKVYDFKIIKLQLVKLYHDIENYGVRFTDDKKGIYITDTYTIVLHLKLYLHDKNTNRLQIHSKLASESEWPQRYTKAFNSHLNFEQTEKAINEFAKNGTEILLVHLSSDEEYQKLELELHYKYKGDKW